MSIISGKSLCKSFVAGDNTINVLIDIDVQINSNELTMLVGPSGCGKTTLISILAGVLSATSGKLSVLGHDLIHMTDLDKTLFRRYNIGFIFQQFNLLPSITAAENAAIPLLAAGYDYNKSIERAKNMLALVGMEKHVNKAPRELSGGQQQRVAIARAIVHEPKIVICDEPTASLDKQSGKDAMELLVGIAKSSDKAVLIVTHDSRVYKYAERVLKMSDGRIVGDYHRDEFLKVSDDE